MIWRAEVIAWADLVTTLTQASTDGWTLVNLNIHETGNAPVFYVVWSKVG